MNPYEFIESGCELILQSDGLWVVQWKATTYTGQTYNIVGHEYNPDSGNLVIGISVVGNETQPIIENLGNSDPYQRGKEDAVELVLFHDGKKKGKIRIIYS